MDFRRIDDAARDPRLMRGAPCIAMTAPRMGVRPMRVRFARFRPMRVLSMRGRLGLAMVGLVMVGLGVALLAASPPAWAAPPDNAPPSRMVVEAKELVNDENKDTITANGDVRIYYNGRFLSADHVVYDRKTGRFSRRGTRRWSKRMDR